MVFGLFFIFSKWKFYYLRKNVGIDSYKYIVSVVFGYRSYIIVVYGLLLGGSLNFEFKINEL